MADAGVHLNYNNSQKFVTTNTGAVVTGILTATTFSGSGASLTNLNASAIASGTVPTARLGSGTASSSTFLRGDSTFAAVTSTTINNNANNRVITGSGSANTLEGEANLTYDGSKLVLAANSTAYDAFQVGNGLFIGNTTNNVSAAIFHQGGGADLEIGSQDMITFTTGSTAGNATERLRIDSSGRLLYGLTSSTRETSLILQGNSNSYTTNPGVLELRVGQVPTSASSLGSLVFGCTGDKIGATINAIADNADWSSGSSHPTAIRFFTTPASSTTQVERLRIDSSGYTKIGSGTPKAQLDIKQQGNSWEDAVLIQHDNANTGWNIHAERSNSALWIGYNSNTASALTDQTATQVVHLHSNRTTSLVTSNNSYELTIGGLSGGPTLWLRDSGTSGTPRIMFGSSAAALDGAIYYNISSNYMSFYTNGTEHIRIDQPGNLNPVVDASRDLGTSSLRWRNVYTTDLQLSNENTGGNEVDGTEGNWTLQEGETDVYMINRKTGKKYKMMLQEVS